MFRMDQHTLAGSRGPAEPLLSFSSSSSNLLSLGELCSSLGLARKQPCFKSPKRQGSPEPTVCLNWREEACLYVGRRNSFVDMCFWPHGLEVSSESNQGPNGRKGVRAL